MQVVKNVSMYSDVHAGLDENADSDRQFLLEQQRACHARARQYSLETNQRRKALENRRKQWDIKEQKMRTEILQQRKQRLLEITERFQRSHIPPSQRTRPVSSARVPTLDEAFSQIQMQSAYNRQSSFPTSTSNIRRPCSSIPKPPEGPRGSRSPRAVSAAQSYTKLMQEGSLGDLEISQLPVSHLQENLVKDQEKLEQLQTQDHKDSQISHAESLSSLDSLEHVVPQHGPGGKLGSLGPLKVHDTRRPSLPQRQLKCPSPLSNHYPPTSFQEKLMQDLPILSGPLSPSTVEDESADDDGSVQKMSPGLENAALQRVEADRHTEKYKRAEYPNLADNNNKGKLANGISPKLKKESEKTSADTLTSHIALKYRKVRFLKGILKTKSKCIEDGGTKFGHSPGNFAFSKQLAIAIRDSLELSRFHRDINSNDLTKKKLRWIDEMHIDGEENENMTKELMSIPTDTKINMTSSPADPNSTKHDWSDPQKAKHLEPADEFRMEKATFRPTGLCVPRRAHSAKTDAGTILFHARRDTIIRPQSSSQIPHLISTQGAVLEPRPPPRPAFTIKTGKSDTCFPDKAYLPEEQVFYKDFPEDQPLPQCHILKTDQSTILAPVPPSYAFMNDIMSKGIHTFCQPDGKVGTGSKSFRNGIMKGTPTDEEISLLWNDVRRALASKAGASRSLQAHNRPLSAFPHTHANSSHVTIKGDSLSSVKAVARMDSFLLVRSPAQRPTLETTMKTKTAASDYRNPPVFNQARVPITESKMIQMVHDQGSAEFLQTQRGLSALSLEEQKILQSLDRLNHRLQNAQETHH